MATKPTMLTAEGHKKLEDELEFLQNVKRKEIAEKIKSFPAEMALSKAAQLSTKCR